MKSIFLSALLVAFIFSVNAQPPQSFSYQAVARDAGGQLLANSSISVRISILDSAAGGTLAYQESQSVSTNQFGLFTIAIGTGTNNTGTFNSIAWATGNKWVQIDVDTAGGTNFVFIGKFQLQSVPYALYAGKSADNSWQTNGNNINNANTGNVGIGTTTPGMLLDASSSVDTTGNATIRGAANGPTQDVYGLLGITTSTGYNAAGVYGLATAINATGVLGEARSSYNSAGIWGNADSSGWGVLGTNQNAVGNGIGVAGVVSGTGGVGVLGQAGSHGIGVQGLNTTAGADTNTAGYFQAQGGTANYAVIVPPNSGYVGIGTNTPTTLLDIEDSASPALKLTDGTQGSGKILTSDANGNASWKAAGTGIAFSTSSDTNTIIIADSNVLIPFQTINFNDGNAYDNVANAFTAPSAGLYHFDLGLNFTTNTGGSQVYVNLTVNNFQSFSPTAQVTLDNINSLLPCNISTNLKLNQGDVVTVIAFNYESGSNLVNIGGGNYFSGYKVY